MSADPDAPEETPKIVIPVSHAATRSMDRTIKAFQGILERDAFFRSAHLTNLMANIMPPSVQESISTMQREMFRAIEPVLPKFDIGPLLPKFDIGRILPESALQLQANEVNRMFASAFQSQMGEISKAFASALLPQMDEINTAFASIFKQFEDLDRILWPANLQEISRADRKKVLRIIMDEGIPFAWVPPPSVVAALVSADTPAARRRVLVNRRRSIINSCYDLVEDAMLHGASESDQRFVLAALSASDGGHFDAAQAMATLQLDTMVNRDLGKSLRIEITSRDQGVPSLDEYPPTTALVVGAIWASHLRYRPEDGDRVPREYTRHGSVHGVSRRQYTRANAIIAVMHAVAFLRASIDQPEIIKEVRGQISNT